MAPKDSASEKKNEDSEESTSDEDSSAEESRLNLVRARRNQKPKVDKKGNKHSKNGSAKSMKSVEQESNNFICFRCSEKSYIARNCPASTPKKRPTGNGSRR